MVLILRLLSVPCNSSAYRLTLLFCLRGSLAMWSLALCLRTCHHPYVVALTSNKLLYDEKKLFFFVFFVNNNQVKYYFYSYFVVTIQR